jgi:hypothetical protein
VRWNREEHPFESTPRSLWVGGAAGRRVWADPYRQHSQSACWGSADNTLAKQFGSNSVPRDVRQRAEPGAIAQDRFGSMVSKKGLRDAANRDSGG